MIIVSRKTWFGNCHVSLLLGNDMLETATSFREIAHTLHWIIAESIEQNFEKDKKNCLLPLEFDEISEMILEEETIKGFVQDATTKSSFLL